MHFKLVLLGFGNVGRAFARLLMQKEKELKSRYGISYSITGISTGHHGLACNPQGLDPGSALELLEAGDSISSLSIAPVPKNNFDLIKLSGGDVLFENSPVDYKTGQPALGHIRFALESGMHVVTANKGPIVHGYKSLSDLALSNDRKFLFESTVMDGAPIFSLFRETLPAANLISFRGILNSTTNLILTRMETGQSFEDAVQYAQSIGIAETDPSGDVDGWDSAVKVAALVTVLMGIPLTPQQVDRQGIGMLDLPKVLAAKKEGNRWKLVCSAVREGEKAIAKVEPAIVSPTSPLYNTEGTTSIVEFETDVLGKLTIRETDPGPETTAYGLLADFINIVR